MALTGGGLLPYLGTIGNIYMGLLIIILVIGLGLLARKLVTEKVWVWGGADNTNKITGGTTMFNKWFRLALVSFLGIIISGFALGLMNTAGMAGTGGAHGNMSMTTPMGMPMSTSNDNVTNQQMNIMMQRMNEMMIQMNAMMYNMSMMNNMNMGGMSAMPSSGGMGMMNMPMMGMPMGGMGMMNMGGGSMGGMSGGSTSGGGMSGGMSSSGGGMSGGGGGGSMGGMSMM